MIEFYLVAGALIVVAATFVVFPVLQRHGAASSRRATNVDAFRERQAELDSELSRGTIDAREHELLGRELQRRLLDDADAAQAGRETSHRPSPLLVFCLVIFIAGLALVIYQYTGSEPDWEITQTLQTARARVAAGKNADALRKKLLRQIAERQRERPDNPYYLMLKANVEMELARYSEADTTLKHLRTLVPNDPTVMSLALEARYMLNGRTFTAGDHALALRVLAMDPRNARTLGLLGIESFQTKKYADAITYWQKLLPLLGPLSSNGKMISEGIERAKKLLAEEGGTLPPSKSPAIGQARLEVDVALGDNIKVDRDAPVFVYARAVNGPRMPLAVKRLTVADLPARVTLDDSMAMAPGMNLSSAKAVEVVARISKRGIANRSSGDIEGVRGPIKPAEFNKPVAVVIDQVLP